MLDSLYRKSNANKACDCVDAVTSRSTASGVRKAPLGLAHFSRVALAVQVDVSSHPLHMRLLPAPAIVFETDTLAQWVQQFGRSIR